MSEFQYGFSLFLGLISLISIYLIEWKCFDKITLLIRIIEIMLGIISAFATIILILNDLGLI